MLNSQTACADEQAANSISINGLLLLRRACSAPDLTSNFILRTLLCNIGRKVIHLGTAKYCNTLICNNKVTCLDKDFTGLGGIVVSKLAF